MRIRVFDDLAGGRIEASEFVHVVRGVPDLAAAIDTQGIGTRTSSRQLVFLEGFGFRVEVGHLAGEIFSKPDGAVRGDLNSSRLAFSRWRPAFLLALAVYSIQFSVIAQPAGPYVVVLIDGNSVVGTVVRMELGELVRFGIEAIERIAGAPDHAFGIDANRVRRSR